MPTSGAKLLILLLVYNDVYDVKFARRKWLERVREHLDAFGAYW